MRCWRDPGSAMSNSTGVVLSLDSASGDENGCSYSVVRIRNRVGRRNRLLLYRPAEPIIHSTPHHFDKEG